MVSAWQPLAPETPTMSQGSRRGMRDLPEDAAQSAKMRKLLGRLVRFQGQGSRTRSPVSRARVHCLPCMWFFSSLRAPDGSKLSGLFSLR